MIALLLVVAVALSAFCWGVVYAEHVQTDDVRRARHIVARWERSEP